LRAECSALLRLLLLRLRSAPLLRRLRLLPAAAEEARLLLRLTEEALLRLLALLLALLLA